MNILKMIDELRYLGFFAVINTRLPYRVTVTPLHDSDKTYGPFCGDSLEQAMERALDFAKNPFGLLEQWQIEELID